MTVAGRIADVLRRSRDGRVWAYVSEVFAEPSPKSWASPCRIPDHYADLIATACIDGVWRRVMAYRGKLADMTDAALIREQNRGHSDR